MAAAWGPSGALAADGDLDTTFGSDGTVTTSFSGGFGARDVAHHGAGKVVMVGDASSNFAVARFNADGTLDTTFSGDGKVDADFGGGSDHAQAVAVQTDGKIVVVGTRWITGLAGDVVLARYHANGTLDTTFDGDGWIAVDFGGLDFAGDVVIQTDGKIVVAGSGGAGRDFVLARHNANGSLDTSFDGDGKLTTDFGGSDQAEGLAIQTDGKIVAAGGLGGGTSPPYGAGDWALARYNTNGSLDTAFDSDGKVITDLGGALLGRAEGVAIASDGQIAAAGSGGQNFYLRRYTAGGTPFAPVVTDFGGVDSATDIAIQSWDGKLVVAGRSSASGSNQFALARYSPVGQPDTGFSGDGKLTTAIGASTSRAEGLVIRSSNRRIVAGGTAGPAAGPHQFAAARYLGDGTPPPAPSITSTAPASPANNNNPRVSGFAEPSALVRMYVNTLCTGSSTLAFAGGGSFSATISVPDNSTNQIRATATDAAGNVSPCSAARTYVEDSVAQTPSLTATSPPSPANENSPEIMGTAEAGSTVRLYATPTCIGETLATGTAAALSAPGLTISVPDDSTTEVRAAITDPAGNISACSAPIFYVEDSSAPETSRDSFQKRRRRATIAFSSSEPVGARFECKLDRNPWSRCRSPKTYRRLAFGRHRIKVRAFDTAANADPTPVRKRFRLRRPRR